MLQGEPWNPAESEESEESVFGGVLSTALALWLSVAACSGNERSFGHAVAGAAGQVSNAGRVASYSWTT